HAALPDGVHLRLPVDEVAWWVAEFARTLREIRTVSRFAKTKRAQPRARRLAADSNPSGRIDARVARRARIHENVSSAPENTDGTRTRRCRAWGNELFHGLWPWSCSAGALGPGISVP